MRDRNGGEGEKKKQKQMKDYNITKILILSDMEEKSPYCNFFILVNLIFLWNINTEKGSETERTLGRQIEIHADGDIYIYIYIYREREREREREKERNRESERKR